MLNPKRVFFVPYGPSDGLALLAKRLGLLKVRTDGTSKAFRNRGRDKVYICWGKPSAAVKRQLDAVEGKIINPADLIPNAVDKIAFFKLADKREWNLEWTQDPCVAATWLEDDCKVIARTTATGTGGDGITVLRSVEDLETAKDKNRFILFTKYVPKKHEYRVHVVNGEAIACSRKVMKKGAEPKEQGWEVRSHDNGFIFQREDLKDVPKAVLDAAIDAVRNVLHLDFAGVDILWNEKRKKAYVCEVNTAPGIEGGTVEEYALAFEKMLDEYKL